MNRSPVRITWLSAIALSVLITTAVPASAATFKGSGLYSSFQWGVGRGVVVAIDRANSANPRLRVGLVGVMPMEQVGFTFRSIGCGGTPGPGNRVLRVNAMSDAHGDVFFTRILAPRDDFAEVKSVWIDTDPRVCGITMNYKEIQGVVGDWNGDGALAVVSGDGKLLGNVLLLVEKRPNDRARVRLAMNGADGDYRIRLVDQPCGTPPSNSYASFELNNVLISSFKSKTVDLEQEQLDALRSLRIRSVSGNDSWCGPLALIIVVV